MALAPFRKARNPATNNVAPTPKGRKGQVPEHVGRSSTSRADPGSGDGSPRALGAVDGALEKHDYNSATVGNTQPRSRPAQQGGNV